MMVRCQLQESKEQKKHKSLHGFYVYYHRPSVSTINLRHHATQLRNGLRYGDTSARKRNSTRLRPRVKGSLCRRILTPQSESRDTLEVTRPMFLLTTRETTNESTPNVRIVLEDKSNSYGTEEIQLGGARIQ